jgi:hypothetical protein
MHQAVAKTDVTGQVMQAQTARTVFVDDIAQTSPPLNTVGGGNQVASRLTAAPGRGDEDTRAWAKSVEDGMAASRHIQECEVATGQPG